MPGQIAGPRADAGSLPTIDDHDTAPPANRTAWLWLPLWLGAACASIFQHGPMPIYSTRTLSVAWDMWLRHDFLVPRLNGSPYGEKSPLLYWLIHLGWAVGGVGDIWPRLLAIGLGALQLLLALALARRLFPAQPRTSRAVPWVLMAFGYGFLFSLQIMYDVLLSACVLGAFIALVPGPDRARPRFGWFALAAGLGLLAKGPVMLLHVGAPWLLGPLWNPWAGQHRRPWYAGGALAWLGGLLILGAWALPAMWLGGAAYRDVLMNHQTGRLVNAFAHAEPWWWYLPVLPLLVAPFTLWPRLWVAIATLPRRSPWGLRFVFCWLGPALLAFSLVSGKQPYYLVPEYAGLAVLVAYAVTRPFDDARRPPASRWLVPWPLALCLGGVGVFLMTLPALIDNGRLHGHWLLAMAPHGTTFGGVFLMLGVLLFLPVSTELYRVAAVGLAGVTATSLLFGLSAWPAFDLAPAAAVMHRAESLGQPLASVGLDGDDFLFLGRLHQPIRRLHGADELKQWSMAHPDGLIVTFPPAPAAGTVYQQRFRGVWLDIWRASSCSGQAGRYLPLAPAPADR